jgi:hypothetical protein
MEQARVLKFKPTRFFYTQLTENQRIIYERWLSICKECGYLWPNMEKELHEMVKNDR